MDELSDWFVFCLLLLNNLKCAVVPFNLQLFSRFSTLFSAFPALSVSNECIQKDSFVGHRSEILPHDSSRVSHVESVFHYVWIPCFLFLALVSLWICSSIRHSMNSYFSTSLRHFPPIYKRKVIDLFGQPLKLLVYCIRIRSYVIVDFIVWKNFDACSWFLISWSAKTNTMIPNRSLGLVVVPDLGLHWVSYPPVRTDKLTQYIQSVTGLARVGLLRCCGPRVK